MGWRDTARAVKDAGHNRHSGHDRVPEPAIVPTVPIVPPVDPATALREWHRRLEPLDSCNPPEEFDGWRWGQLVDDAHWLYENFASRAVRDGWSALDLFGVLPAKPGLGGLVDRLRGARDLKMTADLAVWTHRGVADRLCRGGGDDLASSGCVPLWELVG